MENRDEVRFGGISESPPAIPRAPGPPLVILRPYNTIRLEHERLYHIRTQFCGTYAVNILNLGPCTVYYRGDNDPHVNDPDSISLPPGSADNNIILADGEVGLRLIAGAPCVCQALQEIDDPDCHAQRPVLDEGATISVRLVQL